VLNENREIIRRFNEEVWGEGRLELVDELCSADLVNHSSAPGGLGGRDGVRHEVQRVRALFPDLLIHTGDIICEGDRAALRWTGEGTYQGGTPGG
jgi:predicted ester cyclase